MLPILPVLVAVVALAAATAVGVAELRRRRALVAYTASIGGTYAPSDPALACQWTGPATVAPAGPRRAQHVVRGRAHDLAFTAFECVGERTGRLPIDPRPQRSSVVVVVHRGAGEDLVLSHPGPLRPQVVDAVLSTACAGSLAAPPLSG